MSNIFLDDQEATSLQGKGSFAKYELKIQHLNDLNKKIYIENQHLRSKVKDLEQQKMQFIEANFDEDSVIKNIERQLRVQRQNNQELSKQNQELLAKMLLNQQLNIETKKQFDFYLNRYEQKILELRQNLQMKEVQIQNIQEKYEKYKGLQLPISVKNANRYTAEMLKYETLIEEMIEERNREKYKNVQQVNVTLKYFQRTEAQLQKIKPKKGKSHTTIPSHTDIRSKTAQLTQESQDISKFMNKDRLDVMFLRLHLQLRQLKKKYKDKLEENIQLRNKDKIMKQGYITLTKEMEKVKIQNCQLKIQLQHLDKKIKTSKQIVIKTKSTGYIPKNKTQNQNVQSKISSQVSIEGNFSQIKNYLKVSLPSQTKYDTFSANKSHNFDQKIENIEGILSLDSDPDFSQLKSKKKVILEKDQDENLSICEQNEVDMSISLDTSGFAAPTKSHHQISEHILTGLFDKRVF